MNKKRLISTFMALAAASDYPTYDKEIRKYLGNDDDTPTSKKPNPENPHNYPKFVFDDGMVIYAYNQTAANEKYQAIMKKRLGK